MTLRSPVITWPGGSYLDSLHCQFCGLERYSETFKFERAGAKSNILLATLLVYSYDTIGGSLSLKYTGILYVTDVNHRSAGRFMASTALLKNLIFIKCFGFSARTSLLTGLSNL